MEESDRSEDIIDDLIRLIHGIESNMENLLAIAKIPDFLPGDGYSLEISIEAQTQMLNHMAGHISTKDGLGDFVRGKCKAVLEHPDRFLNKWYDTNGKPCLKCGVDKSKCVFYKVQEGEKPISGGK